MTLIVVLIFALLNIVLAVYLVKNERGPKKPVIGLLAASLFGVFSLIIGIIIESFAVTISDTAPLRLGDALHVGIIEEAAKFLPLALFIRRKPYFDEVTDGIIYFGIVGMSFGFFENAGYTLMYGVSAGIARLILTPLFHTATTAIIGYFFARWKLKLAPLKSVILAFTAIVLLHAAYDYFLSGEHALLVLISLVITFGLDIYFFVFYNRAVGEDRKLGLSLYGPNRYCTNCGRPNPQRSRFCSFCGNHM